MVNSLLYVLPVIENDEALSYYCLVNLVASGCTWILFKDDALLSYGVCDRDDVGLMLDSFGTDLSLSGGSRKWAMTTIH